jgi:hypothetical protein
MKSVSSRTLFIVIAVLLVFTLILSTATFMTISRMQRNARASETAQAAGMHTSMAANLGQQQTNAVSTLYSQGALATQYYWQTAATTPNAAAGWTAEANRQTATAIQNIIAYQTYAAWQNSLATQTAISAQATAAANYYGQSAQQTQAAYNNALAYQTSVALSTYAAYYTAVAYQTQQAYFQNMASARTATAQADHARGYFDYYVNLAMTRPPLAGPFSGSLVYPTANYFKAPGVLQRDFVSQVDFYSPSGSSLGAFDFGFFFRYNWDPATASPTFLSLYVASDGTWGLYNGRNNFKYIVNQGQLTNLDQTPNGLNRLRLVAIGNSGAFYLNDAFITSLDLGSNQNPGEVMVVIGVTRGREGQALRYSGFQVWPTQ